MNRVTQILLTASCLAAAAQAQANWPSLLASNTTGVADSVFLGPSDGSFVGLGSAQVTFDFGDMVIVNRYDIASGLDLTDFNLYEWNGGPGNVNAAIVLVSQDGVNFFEATPRIGLTQRIPGDSVTGVTRIHGRNLGGLEWARYVRVLGTSKPSAGWHQLIRFRCPGCLPADARFGRSRALHVDPDARRGGVAGTPAPVVAIGAALG